MGEDFMIVYYLKKKKKYGPQGFHCIQSLTFVYLPSKIFIINRKHLTSEENVIFNKGSFLNDFLDNSNFLLHWITPHSKFQQQQKTMKIIQNKIWHADLVDINICHTMSSTNLAHSEFILT